MTAVYYNATNIPACECSTDKVKADAEAERLPVAAAEVTKPCEYVSPAPARKLVVWSDQEKKRALTLKHQGVTYSKIATQLTEELGRPVTKSHIVNLFNRDLKHAVLNTVEASLGASSEAVEPTTKAKALEVPTREKARPKPAQSDKAPGDLGCAGKVEDEEGSYKQGENKPGDDGEQKIKKVESADFVKLYASLVYEVWKVLETREMEEERKWWQDWVGAEKQARRARRPKKTSGSAVTARSGCAI